jgi:hypothetical protein
MSYKYFPSMSYKYSPNDVLTLKGAAAQQTTHPGNLIYYQLCEERFAEYESSSQQQRREICHEIATSIVKKRGGVFRKYNGSKMDEKAAITKTKDRMRQIQKPKIVPPENVGEHDVVFKVGAANHLFPGNAKWRALLDKYVQRYWPELFPTSECNGSTPTATNLADADADANADESAATQHPPNGRKKKPDYQVQLAHELIDIIKERGGKFRNATLTVVTERDAVVRKIHDRFKDLKKYIKAGKYQSATSSRSGGNAETNADFYVLKRTGCTSAKVTVPHGQEQHIHIMKANKMRKKKEKQDNDDSDDNDSFDSKMLTDGKDSNDDSDNIHYDSNDEYYYEEERRKANKLGQDEARHERLKRRAEAATASPAKNNNSQPLPKRRRRRESNKIKEKLILRLPPVPPDHEISDYERLRFEKMKRNHERLAKLGLLGGFTEK